MVAIAGSAAGSERGAPAVHLHRSCRCRPGDVAPVSRVPGSVTTGRLGDGASRRDPGPDGRPAGAPVTRRSPARESGRAGALGLLPPAAGIEGYAGDACLPSVAVGRVRWRRAWLWPHGFPDASGVGCGEIGWGAQRPGPPPVGIRQSGGRGSHAEANSWPRLAGLWWRRQILPVVAGVRERGILGTPPVSAGLRSRTPSWWGRVAGAAPGGRGSPGQPKLAGPISRSGSQVASPGNSASSRMAKAISSTKGSAPRSTS